MKLKIKLAGAILFILSAQTAWGAGPVSANPFINILQDSTRLSPIVEVLIVLTFISFVPTLLIIGTSFMRIIIVLSFLRHALGTQQAPSNQILIGISIILTFFVMTPTFSKINERAIQPYLENQINWKEGMDKAIDPIRDFLAKQTRKKDLALIVKMSQQPHPSGFNGISLTTLTPAFVLSELKTAFEIGFLIFIPFLIIDMVVASILMSMGMMMVPPVMISLPLKILLFVMVDGWHLIVSGLVQSFR